MSAPSSAATVDAWGIRYIPTLQSVPAKISQLLESYSSIAVGDQVSHIQRIRDKVYVTKPYPCLGRFRFLELDLSAQPSYESYVVPFLSRRNAEPEPVFLDLGTCLGQDMRKLIFDGVPQSRVWGSDIEQNFIDTGYELFKDEAKFPKDQLLCPANVFDMSLENKLSVLDDKVDVIHAGAVFHLFGLEEQKQVAVRCLRLLRKGCADGRRALVLGGQASHVKAHQTSRSDGRGAYRHDEKSWGQMWRQVCDQPEWRDTIEDLQVSAILRERAFGDGKSKTKDGIEDGTRWMNYEVWVTFQSSVA